MRLVTPEVLVGDYDWDAALIPVAEYEERLKKVWERLSRTPVSGVIVYGNKIDNAALGYVSNFTPKIESAVALLSRDGELRIHSQGSPQMMLNARRLTWIEDVRPLRDLGKDIAAWAEEKAHKNVGVWTTDEIPSDLMSTIETSLKDKALIDVSGELNDLLRQKSTVAVSLIRQASQILDQAAHTLRKQFQRGVTAREAAIAAEITAADAGAQDVRVLISFSNGGTPTAIDYPAGLRLNPLLAYIAVRHAGYWAEGFLTLASTANETVARTKDALEAMLAKAKAGTSIRELSDIASSGLLGIGLHPNASRPVVGIGLMLEEPEAASTGVETLEAGRIYSLRAGAQRSPKDNALLSAMIMPTTKGVDVLWSSLAAEAR